MPKTVRFAVGTSRDDLHSSVWRMSARGDDVYLIPGKAVNFKVSLHQSGVWAVAIVENLPNATIESGLNRRLKHWKRPEPYAPGFVRGPSIFVPHTTWGARLPMPVEKFDKPIHWVPNAPTGKLVEFQFYFTTESGTLPNVPQNSRYLDECKLRNGRVVLHFELRDSTPDYTAYCERLLRETVVTGGPRATGSFFIFHDEGPIGMITDLPVPVNGQGAN